MKIAVRFRTISRVALSHCYLLYILLSGYTHEAPMTWKSLFIWLVLKGVNNILNFLLIFNIFDRAVGWTGASCHTFCLKTFVFFAFDF